MRTEYELNLEIAQLVYPSADVQVDERLLVIVVYLDGKRLTFPWYTRSLDSCVRAMEKGWDFSIKEIGGKYRAIIVTDGPLEYYNEETLPTREYACAEALKKALEGEKGI